jgi:hypothetical protein
MILSWVHSNDSQSHFATRPYQPQNKYPTMSSGIKTNRQNPKQLIQNIFLKQKRRIPRTNVAGDSIAPQPWEPNMHKWSSSLKIFSHVVLLLMLAAIVYAAYISITYWSGINV